MCPAQEEEHDPEVVRAQGAQTEQVASGRALGEAELGEGVSEPTLRTVHLARVRGRGRGRGRGRVRVGVRVRALGYKRHVHEGQR